MTFPVVLVDGNNFLYRAYYSTAKVQMNTSYGLPTGAIKVYVNMLAKLHKIHPDATIAVVFDAAKTSFRNDIYPEYKATRKPMPDDLRKQIDIVRSIIRAKGFPVIVVPKVEADDVLGSYAVKADQDGVQLFIESGDKDLAQLVSDNVQIEDTMHDQIMNRQGVIDKFGVPPELIRDFLALKGDKVDNIPGLPGIGDVSAKELLNNIGSIDEIESHLDKVPLLGFRGAKNFPEKFKTYRDQLMMSRTLTTIKTDVPLPLTFVELFNKQHVDHAELFRLYSKCEFVGLAAAEKKLMDKEQEKSAEDLFSVEDAKKNEICLNDLDSNNQNKTTLTNNVSDLKRIIAHNLDDIKQIVLSAEKCGEIFYCFLAGKGHFRIALPAGISIVTKEIAGYIPLWHNDTFSSEISYDPRDAAKFICAVFQDLKIHLVSYNVKISMHALSLMGGNITTSFDDVMLEYHMLDSSAPTDIKSMSAKLGLNDLPSEDSLLGTGKNKLSFSDIHVDSAANFAIETAFIFGQMHKVIYTSLSKEKLMLEDYKDYELPLIHVLWQMEHTGVYIDRNELAQQSKALRSRLNDIENRIYTTAGEKFNINSPKQVGEILFNKLNITSKKKTKSGALSTSEAVIQEIADGGGTGCIIAEDILEYRGLCKLISTYIDKLPELILPETGRVHGMFNQEGTSTGRLSSSDPNLQNIPVRTSEGRAVRSAFAAPEGWVILSADYSQIELRMMAHIANEKNMIKAFLSGVDIHTLTAAQMHGISVSEVTPEIRRSAKAINFGLIYGMSPFGLAKRLHIDQHTAKNYIENYFAQYPGVKTYMDDTTKFVHEYGYVETFSGRKLNFSGIKNAASVQVKAMERAAINAPMQGSAAEVIKKAMIAVDKWLDEVPSDTIKLLLQVHDELVFEVRKDKVDEYKKKIIDLMENAAALKVPLIVSADIGKNWSEAH